MRDVFGLVPPEIRAMVEAEEYLDRQANAGRSLDHALREMDPDLSCVFIRDGLPPDALPLGAVSGRWHVRNSKGQIPIFIPITTPDGGYREPDSGVLAELAQQDLWQRGGVDRAMERATKRKRHSELADEQRRDEIKANFEAARRVAGEGGLHRRKWGRR